MSRLRCVAKERDAFPLRVPLKSHRSSKPRAQSYALVALWGADADEGHLRPPTSSHLAAARSAQVPSRAAALCRSSRRWVPALLSNEMNEHGKVRRALILMTCCIAHFCRLSTAESGCGAWRWKQSTCRRTLTSCETISGRHVPFRHPCAGFVDRLLVTRLSCAHAMLQYECRLCLTLHTNEGNYLAHTQGKQRCLVRRCWHLWRLTTISLNLFTEVLLLARAPASSAGKRHQQNLAKRAAREAAEKPVAPAPQRRVAIKKTVRIGRPGYRVTKQFDHDTGARSLLFQVLLPHHNLP